MVQGDNATHVRLLVPAATSRPPTAAATLPCPRSATASRMLYPHQVEGVKWLWSLRGLGSGGILADDMVRAGAAGGRVALHCGAA